MAENASSEIGRLGISRAAAQKKRERRRAARKRRADYFRELSSELKRIGISRVPDLRLRTSGLPDSVRRRDDFGEDATDLKDELSYDFDVDKNLSPNRLVKSRWGDDYDIQLFSRLGLYCYNFQKGTNLKFVGWEKYTTTMNQFCNFYVTLEAMDPALGLVSFQTMLSPEFPSDDISLKWTTFAARIKSNGCMSDYWGDAAIPPFYQGAMPKWLSHDEALAADNNKKYYVVQKSELLENDWPHLFSEIDLLEKSNHNLDAPPLLEIKNVVIETEEEYTTEAREKLKAKNAIFYISYKYNGGDPFTHLAGDHKAIIRKTMDGGRGHMRLEVARGTEEQEQLSSDYQSLYI